MQQLLFALVPLICFILLWLIFLGENSCWRRAFLSAAIAWGTLLTGITEGLSLSSSINFNLVLITWLLIDLILGAIYLKKYFRSNSARSGLKKTINLEFSQPFLLFSFVVVGAIALVTALVAIISPPNN